MNDVVAESIPGTEQAGSTDPGKGLASAIASAFDEIGVKDDDYVPASVKTIDKSNRNSRIEPSTEGDVPAAEAKDTGKQPDEGSQPPVDATPANLSAPAQWDAAKKAEFEKLPEAAKKTLLDLAKHQESDYTKKTQELAGERKFAQAVKSIITPEHRQQLQAAGLDEVTGLKRLLTYQDYALKAPDKYARWFIQTAGLNLADVFPEIAGDRSAPQPGAQPGQAPQGQPQPQPVRSAPDPQIAQLRQAVDHVTGWVSSFQQQQQQNSERQALDAIARFRDAKDEKGVALRPHFAEVEEDMTRLLLADERLASIPDPIERLSAAYEAAVYLNPASRKQAIEAEARRLSASTRRQSDLDKARVARPPISSPAQVAAGQPQKLSLKDQVSQSMKEIGVL